MINSNNVKKLLLNFIMSAMTWFVSFAFLSAILISIGIKLILGLGASLISLGIFSFLFSVIIYKGLGDA